MYDNVTVAWSIDLGTRHLSGDVWIHRTDWGMASPDDRRKLIRDEVGAAVLRALDVDWTVTNANIDDPNC